MDYSWVDDYVAEVKEAAEKIVDIAEESHGERPTITVEVVPLVEVRMKYEWPTPGEYERRYGRRGASPIRVTQESIKTKHKPSLMARKLGRHLNWSKYSWRGEPGGHPNLHTKEYYLQSKRSGRAHSYNGWTPEQLEEPPNALEKMLHPQVSRRVIREQEALRDTATPEVNTYQPRLGRIYTGGAATNVTYAVNAGTYNTAGAIFYDTGTATFTTANTATQPQPGTLLMPTFDPDTEDVPDEE